jgi:hypothetical protein
LRKDYLWFLLFVRTSWGVCWKFGPGGRKDGFFDGFARFLSRIAIATQLKKVKTRKKHSLQTP